LGLIDDAQSSFHGDLVGLEMGAQIRNELGVFDEK
jgi:hypothetical protein